MRSAPLVYCPGCDYPPWVSWAQVKWELCSACNAEQAVARTLMEQREDDENMQEV